MATHYILPDLDINLLMRGSAQNVLFLIQPKENGSTTEAMALT